MKKNLQSSLMLLAVLAFGLGLTASAQTPMAKQKPAGNVNTNTKILYHDGSVMVGDQDLYFIWYGCWDDSCGLAGNTNIQFILREFTSSIGGSPYFQINRTYYNTWGQIPTGAVFYGGETYDRYSHSFELTESDIQEIVADKIASRALPQDPMGIYVVLASADVSSRETGFCVPSAHPHHGTWSALGAEFRYAFVGNPMRCPSVAASQFMDNGTLLPSPNDSVPADAMASTLANLLTRVITNPSGAGWFDRYGLENATKCEGKFGETYLTPNGARANVRLGQRDFLIQQNWVNDRKGRCAMNPF